jgi:hypothetical protein
MDMLMGSDETPEQTLVRFFERNGCLRRPNPERRKAEKRYYKMGYEIRLVANSPRELIELQRTIRAAGLKPGKPYAKVNRWVVPIYGRETMERFVAGLRSSASIPDESRTWNATTEESVSNTVQTSMR